MLRGRTPLCRFLGRCKTGERRRKVFGAPLTDVLRVVVAIRFRRQVCGGQGRRRRMAHRRRGVTMGEVWLRRGSGRIRSRHGLIDLSGGEEGRKGGEEVRLAF